MASKDVHITVVRRPEIDIERLAEALLDLVASLAPEERDRMAEEGATLLQKLGEEEPLLPGSGGAA